MKKLLLLVLINFIILFSIKAQKTYVPDDNFEQALIALGFDSAPLDDSVLTANIDTIQNLNVSYWGISDLTGIEDFLALKVFYCISNQLDSIDFSSNLSLEKLYCASNNLKEINLSLNTTLKYLDCKRNQLDSLFILNNNALTFLDCSENQLRNLILTNNTEITNLICNNNNIKSLDISNDTNLVFLNCNINDLRKLNIKNGNNTNLTNIYALLNPSLQCILVDNATYSNANWISSSNYSFDLPRPIFNSTICTSSFATPTTYIPDVGFRRGLRSLGYTLIGDSIKTSDISSISLLNINTRGIKNLTGIEDFTSLTRLECNDNDLRYIDVSNNTNIRQLFCIRNNLDSINVSNNIAMEFLNCSFNNLTLLNVSNNINIRDLYCSDNLISKLDVTNNSLLWGLICSKNPLDSIDVTQNIALRILDCNNNRLKNLDITQNVALLNLFCHDNQLKSINLSNNTNLVFFYGYNNEFIKLDFSLNPNIEQVHCYSNSLRKLNLANGQNINRKPQAIHSFNNPQLYCIQSDSINYSEINWVWSGLGGRTFHFDSISNYSTDCNTCSVDFDKIQPAVGQVTILDYTYGNNLKYKWYFGDGDSSSAYLPTHNYASAGTYQVCLYIEDTVGSCFDSFCDSITVDTSGILRNSWTLNVIKAYASVKELYNEDFDNLLVYPNPTNGTLYIDFDKKGVYTLYSLDGKKVIESRKLQTELTSVDISYLKTGMYLLRVLTDEGNVITKRIVKQ